MVQNFVINVTILPFFGVITGAGKWRGRVGRTIREYSDLLCPSPSLGITDLISLSLCEID